MNTGDSLREMGALETLTSVCMFYQRKYRTPPKQTLNVNSTDLESKFINNNQMHVRSPQSVILTAGSKAHYNGPTVTVTF
jgi:hypothetical protein